ncbi:MAG TPA: DUF4272 domain-containing protein [Mucilaginibacter sp.]|nr:DUF4272 domain-containing protein [Mucilaginibacter sp.]
MWYTTSITREEPVPHNIIELKSRKDKAESKLLTYGLKDSKITYLPYLDFSAEEFQAPYEVGCRILILWAVSYVASNLGEKDEIANWLKTWGLWDKVSEREKKLFTEELPERALMDFSWHIEAVIVLCWAVNLLEDLPDLNTEISDSALDALMAKLPIDENPEIFLSILTYRDKEEIFIENIINEMITWYLRDKMLKKKENESNVNPTISFERHFALNWIRKFGEISDWDETDTST